MDLSKPAFGPGSEKPESTEVQKDAPFAPQAEEAKVEEPVQDTEPSVEEPETEEQKVPYSRMKRYRDEALAMREEAARWRAEAESLSRPQRTAEPTDEMPPEWVRLYGDTDASKEAWRIQERREQQLIERARQEALEAVDNRRYEETQRIQANEQTIDQELEALSELAGRDLTEKEQSAILDIVDDFTPKDDEGNYIGATIPFEKAWEIYQLKQPKKSTESRNKVAALTGSSSQGEPSAEKAEKDKNWNPLDWGAALKRLGQD